MKKLLMLMAVLLFSAATAFSQTYEMTVTWQDTECNCNDQGESYYEIRYNIYDDVNDVVVNAGTLVRVDFGNNSVDIEVPEVNANCASQWVDPNYVIRADVVVMCDSYNPPQAICSTDTEVDSPNSCSNFANGEVEVDCGVFY